MNFSEIIGQSENVRHLQRAIAAGKTSHAYLFCGEEGTGRRRLALAFASALLCERGGADACGECASCRRIAEGMHPDVRMVSHEKPATISVEDIRTQVIHDVDNRPYGDHKIYIIDEAEKMNESAQNALLKTIEEPPAYAVLILLSTRAEALLPTIRSRVVRLVMQPVQDEEIIRYLMEQEAVPDYRARSIAAFAQNNLGRAVALASSADFSRQLELVTQITKGLAEATAAQKLEWVKLLAEEKEQLPKLLDLFLTWYKDVLLVKAAGKEANCAFSTERPALEQQAARCGYRELQLRIEAIDIARRRLTANVKPELILWELLDVK